MFIKDVMTQDTHMIAPDASVREAARIMADQDVGVLPVYRDDQLTGLVTDRDIVVSVIAKDQAPDTPVSQAMTDKVLYCFAMDETERVAQNMADNAVRRLPVVDENKRLVGMVSLGELARVVRPGGPICFSIHEDVYDAEGYDRAFAQLERAGVCSVAGKEHLDYVRATGAKAWVVTLAVA